MIKSTTGFVTRVTRRVPHVEQERLYPSGAPKFTPGYSGVLVVRSSVFCVVFCRSCFVLFVLSVLRFTASDYRRHDIAEILLKVVLSTIKTNKQTDYPIGIFKLYCIVLYRNET
jgi:hypothetical protein